MDIPKHTGTIMARSFSLQAERGAEGCLLYMSGAAGPSPEGCEAVHADSLKMLVVHPDVQCGDCKEEPPCAHPLVLVLHPGRCVHAGVCSCGGAQGQGC